MTVCINLLLKHNALRSEETVHPNEFDRNCVRLSPPIKRFLLLKVIVFLCYISLIEVPVGISF